MSARLLPIVFLFASTSIVLAGDGPVLTQAGKSQRTIRRVTLIAQVPGVIEWLGSPTKPLAVGDRVEKGQVLVQLDDIRAKIDRQAKRIVDPLTVATAQMLAAESESRMTTAVRLFEQGAIARADKDAAILTYRKYHEEAVALQKAAALAQAGPKQGPTPLERAQLAVEMHCLRSPVNGVVRAIHRTRGEGVKSFEAIVVVEDIRD